MIAGFQRGLAPLAGFQRAAPFGGVWGSAPQKHWRGVLRSNSRAGGGVWRSHSRSPNIKKALTGL